ncbi:hypothetical protein ON010_g18295 [Phytophthora cinnamomi]|nr:hypothetical protein ON010_g18295 [Phytophthora cinnamomi]
MVQPPVNHLGVLSTGGNFQRLSKLPLAVERLRAEIVAQRPRRRPDDHGICAGVPHPVQQLGRTKFAGFAQRAVRIWT